MKPRYTRRLPQALVLCLAPLFASSIAQAVIETFNEQSTGNTFVLPKGTNLLATATPTPTTVGSHESSSTSWSTLTDGLLGANTANAASVTPTNNTSVVFALDLTAQPAGYSIGSFDSYCSWGDHGRDDQDYTISFSTVANPTVFTPLATVGNHTANNTGNTFNSTHSTVTDTTGVMATGVAQIQITFNTQENGYTGFREFVLRAPTVTTLNESSTANSWTLPSGTNLLNGGTANPAPVQPTHGTDTASASWSVVTDNSVGTAGNFLGSVTPNNGNVVTFSLDLTANAKGYNISSFDSYAAWANSGRDNQDFSIRYSTYDAPTVFIPLGIVTNHTVTTPLATHTRLTPSSGFLATNVAAIQLYFNEQENGYAGYREFIALGTAAPLTDPLTWTGLSGASGNASWVTTSDNNWKGPTGVSTPFVSIAPLTFDDTGINRNISVPVALTAASITLGNSTAASYTFGGQTITSSNDITSTGAGSVVFNAPAKATTGAALTGSGSLTFNAALESAGLNITGTGSLTLNAANPSFTGNASVASGTLNVTNDDALTNAGLAMTGGTANFKTGFPAVDNLSGTGGTIVLGNTASPIATTLFLGDFFPGVITASGANITQAAGDVGSIDKSGSSSQTLSGDNTYTGTTTVEQGVLQLAKRVSLYHGTTSSWTASNVIVEGFARLGFNVGSTGEFTDADLTALDMGGFATDSVIGFNTTADFTLSRAITAPVSLVKSGTSILTMTGASTFTDTSLVIAGSLNLANPTGPALAGNVFLGDGSTDVYLDFGANNQLGSNSVVTVSDGPSVANAKVNLRGTSQTIGGLESPTTAHFSIIQNDEATSPGSTAVAGSTTAPGAATLTINATSDHSFAGYIRNQDGAGLGIVKNGAGTQEFITSVGGSITYSGPTVINNGTLKLTINGSSSIAAGTATTIASGATLELAGTVNYYNGVVSGAGKIVKSGTGLAILRNGDNSYSGGTTVTGGILVLDNIAGADSGLGNAPNQHCIAGLMDPSNVITLNPGTGLAFDKTPSLGQSSMLPQYGVTIIAREGAHLDGGQASVVFVPNLTLDGAAVNTSVGDIRGGFNTNICFVGTVIVGGTSTLPSVINAPVTAGPNANCSLGSSALLGTTFQVADVTSSPAADLTCAAILQDVHGTASPLTKTGPGTMSITTAATYTGMTHVVAGTLSISNAYLADAAPVSIDSGATLDLTFTGSDTVNSLTLGGVAAAPGTYGSTSNTTSGIIHTSYITGSGLLVVTTGPAGTSPYDSYASVIANPADRGQGADPDHDGFTNFQEYLFGLSPISPNGSLTTLTSASGSVTLHWFQRANVTYVLQESTDLATWTTSGVTPATAADQSHVYSADYVQMEAVIPVAGAKKFVRVQATANP